MAERPRPRGLLVVCAVFVAVGLAVVFVAALGLPSNDHSGLSPAVGVAQFLLACVVPATAAYAAAVPRRAGPALAAGGACLFLWLFLLGAL